MSDVLRPQLRTSTLSSFTQHSMQCLFFLFFVFSFFDWKLAKFYCHCVNRSFLDFIEFKQSKVSLVYYVYGRVFFLNALLLSLSLFRGLPGCVEIFFAETVLVVENSTLHAGTFYREYFP